MGGTPLAQLLLYRIAREALRNAAKHSSAENITVRLWHEGKFIRMMVADDGSGFDPSGVNPAAHFGLQLMRERVEAFGGDIAIESRPGEGTKICVVIAADPA